MAIIYLENNIKIKANPNPASSLNKRKAESAIKG